jgi:hypothetical protein
MEPRCAFHSLWRRSPSGPPRADRAHGARKPVSFSRKPRARALKTKDGKMGKRGSSSKAEAINSGGHVVNSGRRSPNRPQGSSVMHHALLHPVIFGHRMILIHSISATPRPGQTAIELGVVCLRLAVAEPQRLLKFVPCLAGVGCFSSIARPIRLRLGVLADPGIGPGLAGQIMPSDITAGRMLQLIFCCCFNCPQLLLYLNALII